MVRYIVEVLENGRSTAVLTTASRYAAMACYNELPRTDKRVLAITNTGGEVIRLSDEDGLAAAYAANNQRIEAA